MFHSLLVEDGSGCGHVYVSEGLVRECLAVPPTEWRDESPTLSGVGTFSSRDEGKRDLIGLTFLIWTVPRMPCLGGPPVPPYKELSKLSVSHF